LLSNAYCNYLSKYEERKKGSPLCSISSNNVHVVRTLAL
jgi:hypothetical protein